MEEIRKYILLQSDNTLSYNSIDCFVNDKPLKKEDPPKPPQEVCLGLQKVFYNTFLKRHFKNVVVLAAAGTSLDNGDQEKCGKTREGLWNYCLAEIDAFDEPINDLKSNLFYTKKDIEGLLSHIILFEKLNKEIKNKAGEVLRVSLEKKLQKLADWNFKPKPHIRTF